MAGFEDLIRKALGRHDNPSPQERAAVYRSSQGALERMLAGNEQVTQEAADAQRKRLGLAIQTVEREFRAAAASSSPPPADPPPSPPQPAAPSVIPAPVARSSPAPRAGTPPQPAGQDAVPPVTPAAQRPLRLQDRDAPPPASTAPTELRAERTGPSPHPHARAHARPDDEDDLDFDDKGERERKPFARMLLWVIILVGLALGIWWAVVTLPGLLQQSLTGAVPNPSPTIRSGPFDPEAGEGWVRLFDPQENPQDLDTDGQAEAILLRADGTMMARITPGGGDANATVRLRLPPGPMNALRGRAATFELIAAAEAGESQQFGVQCRFASLGRCGRKRFSASKEPDTNIFDVLINDASLPQGEAAYLEITPDLQGQGRPLDIYALRVRESR